MITTNIIVINVVVVTIIIILIVLLLLLMSELVTILSLSSTNYESSFIRLLCFIIITYIIISYYIISYYIMSLKSNILSTVNSKYKHSQFFLNIHLLKKKANNAKNKITQKKFSKKVRKMLITL